MYGLRGPEASRMKSHALEIPKTRKLAETYANKDNSLGSKEESCLTFDEAVRFYQRYSVCFHLYLAQDTHRASPLPISHDDFR